MTDRWQRPYPPGPFTIAAGAFVIVGLGFFALLTWRIGSIGSPASVVAIFLFMGAAGLAFCWRMFSVGVYVSTRGLRVRNATSTRTLAWSEVDHIYLDDLRISRLWRSPTGVPAIWIKPKDGSVIQTSLNERSAEFLGRRHAFHKTYEQLVEAHHRAT